MFGTKTRTKPERWTEDERARIDAFETACADLSNAACTYAGTFLVHRARMMTAGALPTATEGALRDASAALALELADALGRTDWLRSWQFFRRQDAVPPELQPLGALVESHLARAMPVLHPRGMTNNPVAQIAWPGGRVERRCVRRTYPGLPPWTVMEDVFVQHPVHSLFRAASVAAEKIETIRKDSR